MSATQDYDMTSPIYILSNMGTYGHQTFYLPIEDMLLTQKLKIWGGGAKFELLKNFKNKYCPHFCNNDFILHKG